jgi:hypothetical protein
VAGLELGDRPDVDEHRVLLALERVVDVLGRGFVHGVFSDGARIPPLSPGEESECASPPR